MPSLFSKLIILQGFSPLRFRLSLSTLHATPTMPLRHFAFAIFIIFAATMSAFFRCPPFAYSIRHAFRPPPSRHLLARRTRYYRRAFFFMPRPRDVCRPDGILSEEYSTAQLNIDIAGAAEVIVRARYCRRATR